MNVRRPVAVLRRRTDRADALAPRNRHPGRKARYRLAPEVAVEGGEGRRSLRRVLEDHRGTVVEAPGVVTHAVDLAGKRGHHGRAGLLEEVDRQMHRAPLGMLAVRAREGVARVEQPRLVVTADPRVRPAGLQSAEELARHGAHVRRLLGCLEYGAADREIEHDGPVEVSRDDRAELAPVRRQPRFDRGRLRAGCPAARGAEAIVRQPRMHGAHLRQRVPRRRFADQQVGVLRLGDAPVRREADARAEPDRAERPERRELGLREASGLVVAGGDLASGGDGIWLSEDCVGDRHGELGDRPGLHHVAEVE